MPGYSTIAAIDLGSNSFRLQVAKAVEDQIYPLDSLSEKVRLTPEKYLDEASQERALECLGRFAERIRGLPRHAVRAVGTNTLRVAKNAGQFVRRAEATLGVPIEVVAGREEARLIYLGVVHSLPSSNAKRLIADIGGGSTEFIIGSGLNPRKLESLYMGCVSFSLRFFPSGRITRGSLAQAELAARSELEVIAAEFSAGQWQQAIGSSGTARALAEILQLNGWGDGDITPKGIDQLRNQLLKAGDVGKMALAGLRPDRAPVLPGGFAIMAAILAELKVKRMTVASGAMREGILYDLVGSCSAIMWIPARRNGSSASPSTSSVRSRRRPGSIPTSTARCSPGLRVCMRSVWRSPIRGSTSIPRTSSAMPTCPGFPAWSRNTSVCCCLLTGAASERCKDCSMPRSAGSRPLRCGLRRFSTAPAPASVHPRSGWP
jgi:exopolyphosphatase